MSALQKINKITNRSFNSVKLSKSLQPVFKLPYLTETDKNLFKPEIRDSYSVFNNIEEHPINSYGGCNCKCVWCGWPQNQKLT